MSGAGHQQLKAWEAEPIYLKVSMLSPICPKKYFVLWVIFKYASKWVGLAAHHWATANGMGWGAAPMNLNFFYIDSYLSNKVLLFFEL